ncbi:MAG: YdiU family protein [Proteobacteria bacterium]|nr:YdiU family protein [Pseudomonadota bacterium]MBK8957038.1 YdiU family protein [Pseudomonadota bacterium]
MNAEPDGMNLAALRFDNRFVAELPADPVEDNYRRAVEGACWSKVAPTPVAAPRLVAFSPEVARLLNLTDADCRSPAFTEVFAGNRLLHGMVPYATVYGGHQFGNWAGQLGDGRAINLGEVVNNAGQRLALQLKGAGPTPYSRGADGLAVLRSSLREFLCSEAMHHLGVPTTRALSLVLTGEQVVRDMFYDGHPRPEPGAVVCRVAPSFTRFGHFQIHAARQDLATLEKLVAYTLTTDFPELGFDAAAPLAARKDVYLRWFGEVCLRTARLMADWMRVGFVHGVMNTDNMSILGITIDYGPYGWLENFDPDWTPNTTDAQQRRYRYGQQPQIALWNLVQLANAIYPLIGEAPPLEAALDGYGEAYQRAMHTAMAAKLGLRSLDGPHDDALLGELLGLLASIETDMTVFFRALAGFAPGDANGEVDIEAFLRLVGDAYYVPQQIDAPYRERLAAWLRHYATRLRSDDRPHEQRRAAMNAVNPRYVLRNYLAQLAIDAAEAGDNSKVDELLDTLRHPYSDQAGRDHLAAKRPDWARQRAGCSMLSCSS